MVIFFSLSLGCVAFLGLTAIILTNRPANDMAWRMFFVCVVTAIWAGLAAAQIWWLPGAAHAFENFRSWIWLDLLLVMLAGPDSRAITGWLRIAVAVLLSAALLSDLRFVFDTASPIDYHQTQFYSRIGIAVLGLLLVENVYRNGTPGQRWNIAPICLAAAAIFGFDFYVFSDSIVQNSVSVSLLATRGIVLLLISPLVLITLVRNQHWRVYVHVSRGVVFHTATLTIGGVFLLAAGAVASFIGQIGGLWGDVFRLSFVFAVALALVVVLSITRLRSQLWRFINENFFSSRYDYRVEWLRFVETVSSASESAPLQERVIRALAAVVDSPAGVLWLEDFDGAFRVARQVNMQVDPAGVEGRNSELLRRFQEGQPVIEFDRASPASLNAIKQPVWVLPQAPLWLAIALVQREHVMGFIVLAPPRAQQSLNWESFDLLRTLGRQAASYLAEEKSLSTLIDARALIEYSKNFGFVAHDIKNVSGQLSMLAANAVKFGEDPNFRKDMIQTLQHAAQKLKTLLDTPRTGGAESGELVDPVQVVQSLADTAARAGGKVVLEIAPEPVRVRMMATQLESAVGHLLTNALEASAPGDPVVTRVKKSNDAVVIEIEDRGSGMDPEFVRNVLFTPRRSTKADGHGIGAYQAREIVRAAGGNLKVTSTRGKGTLMQIWLPDTPIASAS